MVVVAVAADGVHSLEDTEPLCYAHGLHQLHPKGEVPTIGALQSKEKVHTHRHMYQIGLLCSIISGGGKEGREGRGEEREGEGREGRREGRGERGGEGRREEGEGRREGRGGEGGEGRREGRGGEGGDTSVNNV